MIGNENGGGFARIVNGLAELIKVITEADKNGSLPRRGRREKDGVVVEYSMKRRVLGADADADAMPEPEGGEPAPTTAARRRRAAKPAELQPVEPVTDVFDEPGEVVVLYELPGIERRRIHFQREGDILTLEARGDDRLYRKELLFEAELAEAPPRTRLRNGVFELRLKKRG